jgi:hypothetical protein
MQALFVHGMGRSPISAIPLLWRLERNGISPFSFFYVVTFQNFASISRRLQSKIIEIAENGDYVLIGHSLGGVLIRNAIASLPAGTKLPDRVFLLGSPIRPSRIAHLLRHNWLYSLATRDCGQLLASEERMTNVPPSPVPTTSIIGTRCLFGLSRLFGDEENDSVVSYTEVTADWITEEIRVPLTHTFLPSHRAVSEAVISRIPLRKV